MVRCRRCSGDGQEGGFPRAVWRGVLRCLTPSRGLWCGLRAGSETTIPSAWTCWPPLELVARVVRDTRLWMACGQPRRAPSPLRGRRTSFAWTTRSSIPGTSDIRWSGRCRTGPSRPAGDCPPPVDDGFHGRWTARTRRPSRTSGRAGENSLRATRPGVSGERGTRASAPPAPRVPPGPCVPPASVPPSSPAPSPPTRSHREGRGRTTTDEVVQTRRTVPVSGRSWRVRTTSRSGGRPHGPRVSTGCRPQQAPCPSSRGSGTSTRSPSRCARRCRSRRG